jgi:pimeloyl-ACP methyl ester carboxylesterase
MKFLVRKMIYPGSFISVPLSPPDLLSELELVVSDDVKIICWYDVKDPDLPFLIYFHGNAENLQTVWLSGMIGQLQALPVNIVIVDYPGYGRSSGTPHETTVLASAGKTVEWVKETYPSAQIVLCGWSLGAAVVISTAARYLQNNDALIVITAWRSLEDVAREHYPDWMVSLLLKERYACQEEAPKIKCKTLLIHGMRDTIIPVSHSMDLASKFPFLWKHLLVESAGHNDLLSYPEVWTNLEKFIKSIQDD